MLIWIIIVLGSYKLLSVKKTDAILWLFCLNKKYVFCYLQPFYQTIYRCEYSRFKFNCYTEGCSGSPLQNDTIFPCYITGNYNQVMVLR